MVKATNTWRLKNILLKNECANQAVKEEIKKYMEVNENDSTKPKTSGTVIKVVIKGKYIAIQAFLKKEERSQIHNLTLGLKELEKEQQIKPNAHRRQEIIKIRAEINAIKTKKKQVEQINETRAGSLKELTKLINHQPVWSKRKRKGPKYIK